MKSINVKNSKALITISIFEVKIGPLGPPKKIIEPRTHIPNR
jgi:hypothetical protein